MTGATADGSTTSDTSNGLFFFVFSKDEAATYVTLASSGNSLEVAGVSVGAPVPEPATWALMAFGFVGLGYAAFRRNSTRRAIAI
jgi:PEP-CTERM motif